MAKYIVKLVNLWTVLHPWLHTSRFWTQYMTGREKNFTWKIYLISTRFILFDLLFSAPTSEQKEDMYIHSSWLFSNKLEWIRNFRIFKRDKILQLMPRWDGFLTRIFLLILCLLCAKKVNTYLAAWMNHQKRQKKSFWKKLRHFLF